MTPELIEEFKLHRVEPDGLGGGIKQAMSLEQESYLLCWQAEMSARRLRSALGALRNVHDDFRPCQEVHDAVADYLRSAERAASERGHHYKWLTGGKKYTSPRATDGPPDQMDEDER